MSRESHQWVSRLRGITLAERAVLDYLADFVNRNAVGAWPLMRTAAEDLDVSASSVRLHIRKLEKKGHLERKAVYGKDGARIGNFYLLNIGEGELRPERKVRHDPYAEHRSDALSGNEQGTYAETNSANENETGAPSGNEQGTYAEGDGGSMQHATGKEPTIEPTTEPAMEGPPLSPDGDGGGGNRTSRQPDSWFLETWNAMDPERWGLRPVDRITADRSKQLRTRKADAKFDWEKILAKIPTALFVHGKSWFTFDHLIKNGTNYVKLTEGQRDAPDERQRGLPELRTAAGQGRTADAMDELQELRDV